MQVRFPCCVLHSNIHWQWTSRADKKVVDRKGLRKAFFSGGNSACRTHARQHYKLYAEKCKAKGIPEHPRTVPPKILCAREEEAKKAGKDLNTGKLKGHGFNKVPAAPEPSEFSKEAALEHTAKFIIATDQVSIHIHWKIWITHHVLPALCYCR